MKKKLFILLATIIVVLSISFTVSFLFNRNQFSSKDLVFEFNENEDFDHVKSNFKISFKKEIKIRFSHPDILSYQDGIVTVNNPTVNQEVTVYIFYRNKEYEYMHKLNVIRENLNGFYYVRIKEIKMSPEEPEVVLMELNYYDIYFFDQDKYVILLNDNKTSDKNDLLNLNEEAIYNLLEQAFLDEKVLVINNGETMFFVSKKLYAVNLLTQENNLIYEFNNNNDKVIIEFSKINFE